MRTASTHADQPRDPHLMAQPRLACGSRISHPQGGDARPSRRRDASRFPSRKQVINPAVLLCRDHAPGGEELCSHSCHHPNQRMRPSRHRSTSNRCRGPAPRRRGSSTSCSPTASLSGCWRYGSWRHTHEPSLGLRVGAADVRGVEDPRLPLTARRASRPSDKSGCLTGPGPVLNLGSGTRSRLLLLWSQLAVPVGGRHFPVHQDVAPGDEPAARAHEKRTDCADLVGSANRPADRVDPGSALAPANTFGHRPERIATLGALVRMQGVGDLVRLGDRKAE